MPKQWLAVLLSLSLGANLACSERTLGQTPALTNDLPWDEQFRAGVDAYTSGDHAKAIEHVRIAVDAARAEAVIAA